MSPRKPYAKGVAKRAEILDKALEIVAANGYSGATVKELADAVGLSQNGLLHYFDSKDALFTEVLQHRDDLDAQRAAQLGSQDIAAGLIEFMRHNEAVPGLVQLYSRLSNEAAEAHHPSHEYFRARYDTLRDAWAAVFRGLADEGRLPSSAEPERLAVLMIAMVDGLQTQWMYNPDIDMAERLQDFLDIIVERERERSRS